MSYTDNKNENNSHKQKPAGYSPEVRITSSIILACIGAVFIALSYRLVRWIIGE